MEGRFVMALTRPAYRQRIADEKISRLLKTFGALCIEGPKWCGKTWTSLHHAESVVYMGDPTNNFQNRTMAELSPDLVLVGESPRLVDEWQEVPPIWDAVRFAVDQEAQKGKFILTGSATPEHKGILHSGTGRIGKIRMRTMSLYESGDSTGQVSLADLFAGIFNPIVTGEVDLCHLIDLTVRGGWPGSLDLKVPISTELAKSYLDTVVYEDMYKVDGIKRDYKKAILLLRSLARNECTIAGNAKLAKDIQEYDGESIDRNTVSNYLEIFQRLFILEDQPAFSPKLRSSIRVGKSPKRHFADPSLAVAALGINSTMLLQDLNTFGFLFEALCERDLRIYAEANGGRLFHYRDGNDREIDAVVEMEDGRWGAFEIKLGANQIDKAANNLLAMKKAMTGNEPAILCVICGMSNMAYLRKDGVMVVPITALKD